MYLLVNKLKTKKMAINKVDLTVSQLINDLNDGLTWLKKDDVGFGSIEAKYGANEKQIAIIRKHPSLKNAETNITIFNIIDDLKPETSPVTKNIVEDKTLKTEVLQKADQIKIEESSASFLKI